MSAQDVLDNLTKRLVASSPVVAQQAVIGIYATLKSNNAVSITARADALAFCLTRSSRAVLHEATSQLLTWVQSGGLPAAEATDLLLNALPAASTSTAPPLADALVRLLARQALLQDGSSPASARWTSHPLMSALLSSQAAAGQLLGSCMELLSAGSPTPAAAHAGAVLRLWAALEPFFSCLYLQRWAPAERSMGSHSPAAPLLATLLHGHLVRLASGRPELRLPILAFLTGQLALGPRGNDVDRLRAAQSVVDILDVAEAACYDNEESQAGGSSGADAGSASASAGLQPALQHLAGALLQLAFELRAAAGSGGAEVAGGMLRLQALLPGAYAGQEPALALLTLGAFGTELKGYQLLLHRTMQEAGMPSAADASMALQPLLSAVAFSTDPSARTWPAVLIAAVQHTLAVPSGHNGSSTSAVAAAAAFDEPVSGDLCLLRECQQLLLAMWASSAAAAATASHTDALTWNPEADQGVLRWLESLALLLRRRRQASAEHRAAAEQLPFALKVSDVVQEQAGAQADANPALVALLAALLSHPGAEVRIAASAAARELLALLPMTGLPLLPLVMYQLQRGSSGGNSGAQMLSQAQLSLLQLLPVMAADQAVAPYALRVLQPMLQPEAPEALRCLALKLTCDVWLLSGRGWPRVEAALNGLAPPGARPLALALRLTRAALVRAVCDKDPGRGVELVAALQACICDAASPSVAALGLEALGVLVREDVLDFYQAWKVVYRWLPALPDHPLLASRWVALLAHGSMDAEAYPEKAVLLLDMVWAATKHPAAQVREAAYCALAAYPPDQLERLEALRPLAAYSGPLLEEQSAGARGAIRRAALVAIRFEYLNRRRFMLLQPQQTQAAAGAADGSSSDAAAAADGGSSKGAAYAAAADAREADALRYRLSVRLPKVMLSARAGGSNATQQVEPGPILFCYSRPPSAPPSSGASAAAAAAAAKRTAAEARDAYLMQLRDALRRLSWRSGASQWHPRLAVQGWCRFLSSAVRDAGLSPSELAGTLQAEWEGQAASVAENAGLAAGALCRCTDGLPETAVSGLVALLLQQAQQGRSSRIVRASLLGAAMAATRLHPTDWAVRQQALSALRLQLLVGATALARAGAAAGLAVLAGSLATDPSIYVTTGSSDHSKELTAVAEALASLVAVLAALWPRLTATVSELLQPPSVPSDWAPLFAAAAVAAVAPCADESEELEALPGVTFALTSMLCGVHKAHGLPQALQGLFQGLLAVLLEALQPGGDGTVRPAEAVAAIDGLSTLVPVLLQYQLLTDSELQPLLVRLHGACATWATSSGPPAAQAACLDGRVVGAAATALGRLTASAVHYGMLQAPPSLPGVAAASGSSSNSMPELKAVADQLGYLAAGSSIAKGQHASAARTGAVAGLAALLLPHAGTALDAFGPISAAAAGEGLLAHQACLAVAKQVTRALEALAAGDTDPWVTSAAAFHLASIAAGVAAAAAQDAYESGAGAAGVAGSGAGGRHHHGGGGQSGSLKPLALFPLEGAMRPMAAAALDRARITALGHEARTDVLLTLAASPWLPLADWGATCRQLMAAAASGSSAAATGVEAAVRQQRAVLLLALAHGATASYGLGPFLDELVAPARFRALHPSLQQLLLARLPALLRSLSATRAVAVVQALQPLLQQQQQQGAAVADWRSESEDDRLVLSDAAAVAVASATASSPASAAASEAGWYHQWRLRLAQAIGLTPAAALAAHCWLGLSAVCRTWQAKDPVLGHKDLARAVHSAITAMAALLPALPALQPGEVAQLVAWAKAASTASSSSRADREWPTGPEPCGRPLALAAPTHSAGSHGTSAAVATARPAVTLWAVALTTLSCLRPDFVADHLLSAGSVGGKAADCGGAALAAMQLRCALVAAGHLSLREVMVARSAYIDGSYLAAATTTSQALQLPPHHWQPQQDVLLPLLAAALAAVPQASQVQVLMQTFDAAAMGGQPARALELVAALVAAVSCQVPGAVAAPDEAVLLASPDAALRALPCTLPRLLSRAPWSSSLEAVAQALTSLAKGGKPVAVQSVGAPWSRACLRCLWALRDMLPARAQDAVCSAFPWQVLAQ